MTDATPDPTELLETPVILDTLTDQARAALEVPCEIALICVHGACHPGPCHDHTGTVIPKHLPPRDYWEVM